MDNKAHIENDNPTIYVSNLPLDCTEKELEQHFGAIGLLKQVKVSKRGFEKKAKIWIYRDKISNKPKGDASITYDDPHSASAAVQWFNEKKFKDNIINVSISSSTGDIVQSTNDPSSSSASSSDRYSKGGRGRGRDNHYNNPNRGGRESDWRCPCGNNNYSYRNECNKCHEPKPRNNNHQNNNQNNSSRGGGSYRSGYKDKDQNNWRCMCGNDNYGYRTECNKCRAIKPGNSNSSNNNNNHRQPSSSGRYRSRSRDRDNDRRRDRSPVIRR